MSDDVEVPKILRDALVRTENLSSVVVVMKSAKDGK
jgi:hypothetical protein